MKAAINLLLVATQDAAPGVRRSILWTVSEVPAFPKAVSDDAGHTWAQLSRSAYPAPHAVWGASGDRRPRAFTFAFPNHEHMYIKMED